MYGIEIGYTAGIKPPCTKDCKDRCVDCHSKCKAYLDYREKKDDANSKIYKEVSYSYERRSRIRSVMDKYKRNHK